MVDFMLGGFSYVAFLVVLAAVVFLVIIMYRIYQAVELLKDYQAEQTQRIRNIESIVMNTTGRPNEQDKIY